MPPKKQAPAKKKDNVDKTFGMKNKNKSKKVQTFMKQIQQQAVDPRKEALAAQKAAEKKAKELAQLEKEALFNVVVTQRVPAGVDPKSMLCALFKAGNCNKGAKCRFSHDLNIGRKQEKADLYQDKRQEDTMDKWDEDKLRSVILSKHGNPRTTTDKVCKYFIEAVENGKYGWFWICPNDGDKCMYRHSLPEGFVLKTKEQKRLEKEALDAQPKITLEEFIETERAKLNSANLTPITPENFAAWKAKNKKAKEDARAKEAESKKQLTGRQIILKKYAEDKKFSDMFDNDEEKGDAFDLSQFAKTVDEEDGIKDYGDGENVVF